MSFVAAWSARWRESVLPRTRKWVESWNRVKTRPEDEVRAYILGKCRNGFQVAKKPERDQVEAWVTILAEPDRTRDQLSPLATRTIEYVRQKLEEDGYDAVVNLDETGGVAYAEVHFRTLTRKGPGKTVARPAARAVQVPRKHG